MSKPRKTKKCEYCGEWFKRVKGHLKFCEAKKRLEENNYKQSSLQDVARGEGFRTGQQEVMQTQSFRGKDAIIALTEAVAKLNQALAQVIGEWRF